MKYRSVPSLIAMVCLLTAGCASLQNLVEQPTVEVAAVRLDNLSLSAATLLVDLKVDNPNPIGANLRSISYDLEINNKNILNGTSEQGIKLPVSGTRVVEVPLQVNYFELYDTVSELFAHQSVAYDLTGSVGIGPFDIPFRTDGQLPIPKLPVIRMQNVDVAAISLTGADLVFTLGVENPNAFPIDINELACDIKLGGRIFAEGLARRVDPIGAKDETALEVALRVSFFDLGRSAYRLLSKPATGYELTGEMRVKKPGSQPTRIPFTLNGNVGIHR
jgi:LEA14-like dessication related protein